MASKLDQLVKGAPPPDVNLPAVTAAAAAEPSPTDRIAASLKTPRPPHTPYDPTSLLPSSPPQIYLNLLILEASLRAQYLNLQARRRQNTFVLIVLSLWTAFFTYALFLRPREDGQGMGGSVYWIIDMGEKVAWMGGIITIALFWATGQYERGVRWPRRWVGFTNRGLRNMNCKIVVMKGPWWKEGLSYLLFLIPYQLFISSPGSSYHYVEDVPVEKTEKRYMNGQARRYSVRDSSPRITKPLEEDIAPGGDTIRLLLLPKPFGPDFRENWEIYRNAYWEKENERRADLRKRVKARQREIAKQQGGWLWWTGWRGWNRSKTLGPKAADIERPHSEHRHSQSLSHQSSLRGKRRRPSILREERDRSHSRSSSRSTTPTPEIDERWGGRQPSDERQRRWSSSTTGSASGSRRKKLSTSLKLTPSSTSNSRPVTPTTSSPLAMEAIPSLDKRASTLSTASGTDSDRNSMLVDEKSSLGPGI